MEAGRIRADNAPGHRQSQPQLCAPLSMRIPQHSPNPARRKQWSRQTSEKRHHMREASVIRPRGQEPGQMAIEARDPCRLAQSTLPPSGKHAHVCRQIILATIHCQHINALALRRQPANPLAAKPRTGSRSSVIKLNSRSRNVVAIGDNPAHQSLPPRRSPSP